MGKLHPSQLAVVECMQLQSTKAEGSHGPVVVKMHQSSSAIFLFRLCIVIRVVSLEEVKLSFAPRFDYI